MEDRAPTFNRVPVYLAMLYTLCISVAVAWDALLQRVSIERCDRLLAWWSRRILQSGRLSLAVSGAEHLRAGQAYVFMSNHRSILDIPVLFQAVPGTLRMVAKEELSKVPLWGQALRRSGFVLIDRRDTQAAIERLNASSELFARGVSVWIAPEGTRSRTGELLPFKKGGFMLAIGLGIPVVPVRIDGTADVVPPDSFRVRHEGRVQVTFTPPIPTAHLSANDRDGLMQQVRDAIERAGRAPHAAFSSSGAPPPADPPVAPAC
jgi:1-acyl-sn-glycerol-3-phosphate acyltransferase